MQYSFLPSFPLHLNSITLVSLALLLGSLGGGLAKKTRYLPQISGYILIGFLIGPDALNIVNQSALANARVFIDISISLILFELGRHLDFRWLLHDPSILYISFLESTLTFTAVFAVVYFGAKVALLPSIFAAIIALATSPAVVMMVANDLSAEGPVTRRALILTSLNNLYALLLFITLTATLRANPQTSEFAFAAYRLIGSILLGVSVFIITYLLAILIGKNKENQFVLFVGATLLAMGFAHVVNLSNMLTLFTLGVAARNLDYKHVLMEVDFGWLARLFFVLLFVSVGVHLKLHGFTQVIWVVLAFILARLLAKFIGVLLMARSSHLTTRQNFALGLTLYPMAGVAVGMSNILFEFNPNLGAKLFLVITAVVALLNIIAPITTQIAFIMTGEALKE